MEPFIPNMKGLGSRQREALRLLSIGYEILDFYSCEGRGACLQDLEGNSDEIALSVVDSLTSRGIILVDREYHTQMPDTDTLFLVIRPEFEDLVRTYLTTQPR